MKRMVMLALLVLLAATSFALGPIEDWDGRVWSGWSQREQVLFVAGMMHTEENLRLMAKELPDHQQTFRFLDAASVRELTVGDVVELISHWYRIHPNAQTVPIALVYQMIALREQELQRERGWR